MEKSMGLFMGSDANTQSGSGLLRFRSAPSSLLENYSNGGFQKSPLSNGSISERYGDLEGNKSLGNGFFVNSQGSSETQLAAMDGSYRAVSSMAMVDGQQQRQVKSGSSLMRQSSSPAGLFSHLGTAHNDMAGYTAIKSQMSYLPSSLGVLSEISEVDSENVEASGHEEDMKLGNGNGDSHFYSPRYPFGSWNSSSRFAENFSGLKREYDSDVKLFANTRDEELGSGTHLSHHLSLPNTSAEMVAMEKILQFQDSVPCKIRAKRGCATHPRSIAERVRRTRISERMRKLQDLVPNMDKQTNTADMLDLAVEYIKDLQKQYTTLNEDRANCKCSNS